MVSTLKRLVFRATQAHQAAQFPSSATSNFRGCRLISSLPRITGPTKLCRRRRRYLAIAVATIPCPRRCSRLFFPPFTLLNHCRTCVVTPWEATGILRGTTQGRATPTPASSLFTHLAIPVPVVIIRTTMDTTAVVPAALHLVGEDAHHPHTCVIRVYINV